MSNTLWAVLPLCTWSQHIPPESVEKIPDVAYDTVCHLDSGADAASGLSGARLTRDPQAIRSFS